MKVLIIGKPTYNVILPVTAYPNEGTKSVITEKQENAGGTSVYTAALLAKWGVSTTYTGVVGGDENGTSIKKYLDSMGINTHFMEINYERKTSINYITVNKTNGSSTQVLIDTDNYLTKYKYDFIPDLIITDGTDMPGSIAAYNNFPQAIKVLFANKVNEDYYGLSKRSTYVVANMNFAKALTKLDFEFNKPKQLVNFFQKIKDLNKAEYILMLKERGVLYSSNRQVKMIPAINTQILDDTNAGSVFFGAICYGIINGYGMDVSAKIANIAAGLSMRSIGINSIPDKTEVFNMAGIKEETETLDVPVNNINSDLPVQANQIQNKEVTTNANNG